MAIEFTKEQQRVIDIRDENVLVSAAAGSGKTAVLVERIFSLISKEENHIDIDQLLVVTFTKAAAAEMRERVHKRIAEELDKNPGDAHLQKQYALVHRAMITTIDAFCQNVLRNHFQEIGLDPDFRVMDEGEKQLMRRDVLSKLLLEKYEQGDEAFLDAAMFFAPKRADDSEFEECILDLQNFSESFAWPDKFLEDRKGDNKDTFAKLSGVKDVKGVLTGDPLGIYLFKHLCGTVEGCIEAYDIAIDICMLPIGPEGYKDAFIKERDGLRKALAATDLQDLGQALKDYKNDLPGKLPGIKKGECDDALKEAASKLRNKGKTEVFNIIKKYFTPDLKSACDFSDKTASYIDTLIDITLEFRKRFLEKKAEEHVVDFGDMEHFALNILIDENGDPTPVAEQYRSHFKEIMVDEYQDSNLVQDVLLGAIASKDPAKYDRFMVGDVKQSIYGFRQARPDLFLEKFVSYPEAEGCERIDLSKNFRSRKEVLDSVNDIFEKIMQPHTGGIEYDNDARLYPGADYPEGDSEEFKTELVLFDPKDLTVKTGSGEAQQDDLSVLVSEEGTEKESEKDNEAENENESESESESDEYSAEESEAVVLAREVKELMKSRVTDRKKGEDGKEIKFFRPAKYSDIVILHRSPAKLSEAIGRIFEREGIPISISTGGGYFSVPEIQQVMQFLRAVSNPLNEIPLYGVLVSVFGGYTPEKIGEIRAKHRTTVESQQHKRRVDMPLWEIVKAELPEFAEKLERYRKLSTYRTVRELLQTIFDDHDYLEIVSAMPAGAKRKANVEMLLSYASAYERTSYFGLYHFVRYIDQLEKYTADKTSEADVLGESANVVRLMSIHKSKGLEFPITILAGMGKQFNLKDTSAKLVHDNEFGLGYIFVDTEKRTKSKTLRHELVAQKIKEDTLAEEMRLLYVAMTRAKEKLVMVGRLPGAADKLDEALSKGKTSQNYSDFMNFKSYLDMVMPVPRKCSSINARTIGYTDLELAKVEEQISLLGKRQELRNSKDKADENKLNEIKNRLLYEYPYKNLSTLYTKTTVTELKMAAMLDGDEAAYEQFESRETEDYIPKFRQDEKKISGTVRGDSYHRVMEIMDFDRTVGRILGGLPLDFDAFKAGLADKAEELRTVVESFLDEELSERRITEECREAVNTSKIITFLKSPLAYRMWKSASVKGLFREQPFVLSLSANRVNKEFPESEKVLIQGIIDAYFVENEEIVLLDYKTDSVETSEELVNRYSTQLDYYQEALQRLTGKKVRERLLYSFKLGESINS